MANGNIIFFGTAACGLPFLQEIKKFHTIGLIISQPDSHGGRRRGLISPPVKEFAVECGLPYLQPENLRAKDLAERIHGLQADIGIVIAYGQSIPRTLFSLPRHATVNVHFSLLPRYRGAAPIQRAIENGETQTGITIFEICEAMDAGDIWAQRQDAILPGETAQDLLAKLSGWGPSFLLETISAIMSGKLRKYPQEHGLATLARKVQSSEAVMSWNWPAPTIVNRLRAFTPWPGLSFCLNGKMMKVRRAQAIAAAHQQFAGDILSLKPEGMKVCCGAGTVLEIILIQPAGKKEMTPFQYALGNKFPANLA